MDATGNSKYFGHLPFGKANRIKKDSVFYETKISDRYTNSTIYTAMYHIEHTTENGEPIYDTYNQWRYFAADEQECDKVLAHLWEEFGARGIVAVRTLTAGPVFYHSKVSADMCMEFEALRHTAQTMDEIKQDYWEGDIAMSELLLAPQYATLSDDDIDELLSFAGDDEFVNVDDIREGQQMVLEQEMDLDDEIER